MYLGKGMISAFILFLFFFIVLFVCYYLAKRGRKFAIKKEITALGMIPSAVGRATEMGKVIHAASGGSSTTSWRGPHVVAGMTILGYAAEIAAKNGVPVYVSSQEPDQLVIADDVLRSAYLRGGKPEMYKREYVLYHGREDGSYVAGVWGFLAREKPAVQFLFGGFGGEAILFAEQGNRVGCLQIAATPTTLQIPFFAVSCDYLMIGDEVFAAGCLISGDPIDTSLIVGEDVLKLMIITLSTLGAIFATFASSWLINLLKV